MIKLCIFDLDGTVLDTIAYYGNYALKKNHIEPIAVCEYKYFAGNGIYNLIKNMLQFRNCFTEELYDKVFHDYDAAYNADTTYKTQIFEGLKPVLDKIKNLGINIAIASNKPDYPTKKVVSSFFGEDYFEDGICIIEWGEKIEEILPKKHIKIEFKKLTENDDYREILIEK